MGAGTGSDIFGVITFVLVVVVAVAAIAVIIYGRRLKERRLAAEKELIERREAAHVDAVVIEPEAPIKESEPASANVVEDMPVAAPPASKAEARPKATPRAKAAPKAGETKAEVPVKAEAAAPAETAPRAKAPARPKPAPKAEAAPQAAPPASAEPVATPGPGAADGDITQLKGLGPKLAATLAELGYTRLDQIAALTPAQATELDAQLGAFQGRMARDRWIEQATLLVAGDREAYEAAFGKLG